MRAWNDWRLVSFLENLLPVYVLKPRVEHNLLNWLEPVIGIFFDQFSQQILKQAWQVMFFELRLIVDDAFVNFVVILIEMRWKSYDQLIEESTNAIDIGSSVMTLTH